MIIEASREGAARAEDIPSAVVVPDTRVGVGSCSSFGGRLRVSVAVED